MHEQSQCISASTLRVEAPWSPNLYPFVLPPFLGLVSGSSLAPWAPSLGLQPRKAPPLGPLWATPSGSNLEPR
eukprot:5741004-Pyramimonas_sp.AAC.2